MRMTNWWGYMSVAIGVVVAVVVAVWIDKTKD
jgi:hypothetical protein